MLCASLACLGFQHCLTSPGLPLYSRAATRCLVARMASSSSPSRAVVGEGGSSLPPQTPSLPPPPSSLSSSSLSPESSPAPATSASSSPLPPPATPPPTTTTTMTASSSTERRPSAADTGSSQHTPTERTFHMVDGMTIAAKVWGSEGGIPVLAMHGWLDNAATFDRLGPHLAKAGIHAVCIDHTGHGRSSHRSSDAIYTFADYAFYAMEVVRALGWQKFSVMGHSMGAAVASAIAGSYADVVERAVYIEALGVITRPVAATAVNLREAIKQRASLTQLRSRGIARVYPNFDAAVKARLKTLKRLPGSQTLEESSARLLVKRGLIACGDAVTDEEMSDDYNGPVKFRHDQRLLAPSPVYMTEEQAKAFLSASTCPILAVGGHNGWPWSPSSMAERAAILGDRMQVVRVPGSHHLHLDESTYRGVLTPVVAFLTQHTAHTAPLADTHT